MNKNIIREEDYIQCVHCGMCLEHCPTYRVTGLETESPRGRIYLMRALAEGHVQATDNFAGHISKCLDCRACEAVCPSGVGYGRLVELGKHALYLAGPRSWFRRAAESLFFRFVFPSSGALTAVARALFLYQRFARPALKACGLLSFLPARWAVLERLQPPMRSRPFPVGGKVYAPYEGPPRRRVALLAGCVMRVGFPGVHEATVEVLRRNGCEVTVPENQGCCGALNVHAGERDEAFRMMKRNVKVFLAGSYDAIVVNAAGCGAALKEYGRLLRDDPEYAEKAAEFSGRVKDLTELLSAIGFKPAHPVNRRVAYQDACHLANAQGITKQPRELLKAIPGLELAEMARPDQCCGSAGIYNVVETDLSMKVLDEKVKTIRATEADIVVTANPGCLLQIRYGLEAAGTPKPVLHIAEILNEACGGEKASA